MKTFEQYLKENGIEYRLVVSKTNPLTIYIHPLGVDGESMDYYVNKFDIQPKQALDNLKKHIFGLADREPNFIKTEVLFSKNG